MGKQSVTPMAIIAGVVVLLVVVFVLYRWQFRSSSTPGSAGDVQAPISGPAGRTPAAGAPAPVPGNVPRGQPGG